MTALTFKTRTTPSLSYAAQERLMGEKLLSYSRKAPKHFLQIDGIFSLDDGDDIYRPDSEGDCLIASGTVELMAGSTVRVLIPGDTDSLVAARQLEKMAAWLRSDPGLMGQTQPNPDDIDRTPLPL